MHKIIYLDLYWMMNFLFQYLAWRLIQKALRRDTGKLRGALGSVLGASLACIQVVFYGVPWILISMGSAVLISLVIFGLRQPGGMGACYGEAASFLGMVFLLRGFAEGILEVIPSSKSRTFSGSEGLPVLVAGGRVLKVIFIALLLFGCLYLWRWQSSFREQRRQPCLLVDLYCGDVHRRVMALWDTGNSLREPGSHRPVHILDRRVLGPLVKTPVSKLRCIPYRSLGKENGVLWALEFDRMELPGGVILDHPLVAVSDSLLNLEGEYQMILQVQELEGMGFFREKSQRRL